MPRDRSRFKQTVLICSVFLLLVALIVNERSARNYATVTTIKTEKALPSIIDQIGSLSVLHQRYHFNITRQISVENLPSWIERYRISDLFDFYWLQTGGYHWHLRQMVYRAMKNNSHTALDYRRADLVDYLSNHPEHGVIIDTAPDPFRALFSPLPRTGSSLSETCAYLKVTTRWYPCFTRSEKIALKTFTPLITYAVYDVSINRSRPSSTKKILHYEEIIYLFNSSWEHLDETLFVREILPRYIRLLALAPSTASILFPYSSLKLKYVNEYIDLLIARGLIEDRKRLIKWNSPVAYHAQTVYSTSSPRADLILLHRILHVGQQYPRRELILIIRNAMAPDSYNRIIQTIQQFQLPADFRFLDVLTYQENSSYSLKQIAEIFPRALIVIGMSSEVLSHLIWCLAGTHVVEIADKYLTSDYYEMSLQLNFHYWLARTRSGNRLDLVDFRQLFLRLISSIEN